MKTSVNSFKDALSCLTEYSTRYLNEHTFNNELVKNLVKRNISEYNKILKDALKLNKEHYKTIVKYDKMCEENAMLKYENKQLRSMYDRLRKHPGLVYWWTPDDIRDGGWYCPWCNTMVSSMFDKSPKITKCKVCGNKISWK